MTMFTLMIITTFEVFSGSRNLKTIITILWTFKIPWKFALFSLESGYNLLHHSLYYFLIKCNIITFAWDVTYHIL